MAYDGYRSPQPGPPPAGQPGAGFTDYSQIPAGYSQPYSLDPRDARPNAPSTTHNENYSQETLRDPRATPGSFSRGDGYSLDPARDSRPHSTAPPRGDGYSSETTREAVSSAFHTADTSKYPPELIAQITEDVIKRLNNAGLENAAAPKATPMPYPGSGSGSPSMASRSLYTPPSPRKNETPSTTSPSVQSSMPTTMPSYRPTSPREPRSPRDSRTRFSEREAPSPEPREPSPTRNKPSRMYSVSEESPLDKTWGTLFDEAGKPTLRLGQILRGLANRINKDFMPAHSLVVTPSKMAKYYELFKLPTEYYPWTKIFEGPTDDLSRIYCELDCEHHFVQVKNSQTPYIPALTPRGFAQWMTILLLAHPDDEVQRLQQAILHLAIDNPDALKEQERFPKEVNRRLFPKTEDTRVRGNFRRALKLDDANDSYKPSKADIPSRTKSVSSSAGPPPKSETLERERKPYGGPVKESSIDESPAPSIERERKPYTAQPGGGKTYESESEITSPLGRTQSVNRPRPSESGIDIPLSDSRTHHRTSSIANGPSRRRRSNSYTRDEPFRRSDNDLLGYPPSNAVDIDDDRRRPDWARRAAEEEARSYDSRDKYIPMPDVGSPPKRGGFTDDYYRSRDGSGTSSYGYNQPYPPYH